jgi:hypothetical protein
MKELIFVVVTSSPIQRQCRLQPAELRQRLVAGEGRAVGLTARQAIHGLGGVGKTRLAVEYAWPHASDYKDALLFVSARTPIDLRANLAELCNSPVLNLREWNQPEEMIAWPPCSAGSASIPAGS